MLGGWEAKASECLTIALPPGEIIILLQKIAKMENRWHQKFWALPDFQPLCFPASRLPGLLGFRKLFRRYNRAVFIF
jgi:hypothetical protein